MHIGIDFDNTIVCYDRVFHAAALERGLIRTEIPASKQAVRDHLRESGREADWTKLQGYVYGIKLLEADAYPGVIEFIRDFKHRDIPISIISHKTRVPYSGPKYDLHRAAMRWIASQSDLQENAYKISFHETKLEKLAQIRTAGCTHFIDDLPEFLTEPAFPRLVTRVLFDPEGKKEDHLDYSRQRSWLEISSTIETLCLNDE
tara:strand:- start:2803 stop:3411 length:609 start_codon:yes stop_codon:yes gene_type:complete